MYACVISWENFHIGQLKALWKSFSGDTSVEFWESPFHKLDVIAMLFSVENFNDIFTGEEY